MTERRFKEFDIDPVKRACLKVTKTLSPHMAMGQVAIGTRIYRQ
jgi:hypothetical protein